MKEFEVAQICPYTGLRSFTEEESLYFKGRDLQVDQITALVEQNKFLMVTGASGEGKSSLIYAGLIPNARAGFFKAKYTNWVVADFRPERTPVVNMAKALSESFQTSEPTVETELRRGFSSLVDLYTNSDFYTDETDERWDKLTTEEKKEKKRKAANLLIIVDQFEEFFTNPENFFRETPSQDSQVVVNLVLETARIAIKRNLPVYVVCTMRSDYIGQCSVFRGLPEYIGFSQFFVPRLKRKDLKQVIEEPAILSGNKISQRLVERLVYDISEGVDQLPILQHSLSQIWLAASNGEEEMDLIHYAMVGGMQPGDLPDADQARFESWFTSLPQHHRSYYKETGLNKIIEIHASLLYENAWSVYNSKHPELMITQRDAKRIIALAFSCLTKIDNSRAVRNRMTLGEICTIINTPFFSVTLIGEVLNIYREEGNSFIRPFITDDESTKKLSAAAVLDITHESLIRNWDKLNKWANQEFDFYSTYLDFKMQLDRWKNSGKSSGYLLPIGPLTFFETWFARAKPNAGWIKRYSEIQGDPVLANAHAGKILTDTREFLKRSGRKVAIQRAFVKYGPQRIAVFAAITIMLVLSGFYWYDAEEKTNARVVERVRKEAANLVGSKEVDNDTKAVHLLIEERYMPGSLIRTLSSLDFRNRLELSIVIYKYLQYLDKDHEGTLKTQLQEIIAKDLRTVGGNGSLDFIIKQGNKFNILLLRDEYYNPNTAKEQIIHELTGLMSDHALSFYRNKNLHLPGVTTELNVSIQLWLTAGLVDQRKVNDLITSISPKAGENGVAAFGLYYPHGGQEPNGRQSTDYNGGFHTLASLYAVAGDGEGLFWSFNKMLETNQRPYFELGRIFNNHLNVIGYCYQYHHVGLARSVVKWVTDHTADNPPITVYRNIVIRSGYISDLYIPANMEAGMFRSFSGYLHPNLYLADRTVFAAITADYEAVLEEIKDRNEKNFQLAMELKRKAMFMYKYWYDRKIPIDENLLDTWLAKAIEHYSKVGLDHRSGKVVSTFQYYIDGVRTSELTRHELFIYPDYRDGWFSLSYHSNYFFEYLRKHGLLPSFFKTGADLQSLHLWIARAFQLSPFPPPGIFDNRAPLPDKTLSDIISFTENHGAANTFDRNLPLIVLANNAIKRGDTLHAMSFYKKIDRANISRSYDRYEYLEKTFFLNMMKQLSVGLARAGKRHEAVELAELCPTPDEKMQCYISMADGAYNTSHSPLTFTYLDSAFSKSPKVEYDLLAGFDAWADPRHNAVRVLSRIGSDRINKIATELLRDVPEKIKFIAITNQVVGVSAEGNFYRARAAIPGSLTESQDLECRSMILLEACRAKEKTPDKISDKWKSIDRFYDWRWNYIFFVRN